MEPDIGESFSIRSLLLLFKKHFYKPRPLHILYFSYSSQKS